MVDNYTEVLNNCELIHTERLILRKFNTNDAKDVLEFGSDEQTLKYLAWDGIKTIEDAKATIVNYYQSSPGIYAIELKENKKCIGCFYLKLESEHEKASFAYVLNRQYWSCGYMTEALAAVFKFCFEGLKVNRIESNHYMGNEGSGRVMQKCGMNQEGIGKQEVKIKGIFHDVIHYGITKENCVLKKLP